MNKQKIQSLLTESRKSNQQLEKSVYTCILSVIQARESRENKELSNDEIISVIQREKKQYEESLSYVKDNKDQSEELSVKIQIINDLLPQEIPEEKYDDIIAEVIKETNASTMKDLGKIMGVLKTKYGATIDMSKASKLARGKLQ